MGIIFICGIHGVGKSTLCQQIKDALSINFFSASSLIKEYNDYLISKNKIVGDINKNQEVLIQAVLQKKQNYNNFILDGHVTLLTDSGIEKIPLSVFENLQISICICITNAEDIIYQRRVKRDNLTISKEIIKNHQLQETSYAKEIANHLKIPFFEISSDNIKELIQIIKEYV